MASRVAEHVVRKRPFGRAQRLRVELHGISRLGPGDQREVMRWEWVESITADEGVVVSGNGHQLTIPPGAFGLEPAELAELLQQARHIEARSEVIGRLNEAAGRG
ncbi:MAG: hypothetical protein ACRD0N_00150 [Acidimicrobiales bacterium]